MKFFDSVYSKSSYFKAEELYKNIEKLIRMNYTLLELENELFAFFDKYERRICIDSELLNKYMKAFKNIKNLKTQNFWKNILFDTEEAKIIYNIANQEDSYYKIFKNASENYPNKQVFKDILEVERILSHLDNLFEYVLINRDKHVRELNVKYLLKLKNFNFPNIPVEGSAKERFERLKKINNYVDLIIYHKEIMDRRGQSYWVDIVDDVVKVTVSSDEDLEKIEKKLNSNEVEFKRDYYLYSVLSIKRGLNETL
jgi:hypothetical protein